MEQFDKGAEAWVDYNKQPLGRIRRAVTWHNLSRHLPPIDDPDQPPYILDAGGGSGELALQLLQRGYRVCLADYASSMLDQARRATRALPGAAAERLSLCHMPTEDLSQVFPPSTFHGIACHTLIEYLPDPRATLHTLSGLLRHDGVLSVSFVNRHAAVLRRIWSGVDPGAALAELDAGGNFFANLFDLQGQAYSSDRVREWLESIGLVVSATYGVRIFADFLPPERLQDAGFFEALLRLERKASSRDPYRLIARYAHLVARQADSASGNGLGRGI
jgi:S-adenosylmethionine-dependent methyltransferase